MPTRPDAKNDGVWTIQLRLHWFCLFGVVLIAVAGCSSEKSSSDKKTKTTKTSSRGNESSDRAEPTASNQNPKQDSPAAKDGRRESKIKVNKNFVNNDGIGADPTKNDNRDDHAVGSTRDFANHVVDDTTRQNQKLKSKQLTASSVELIKQGKVDEALKQLQQALIADKGNIEAIFRAMSILDDRGQQKIKSGNLKGGYADLITAGVFAKELVGKPEVSGLPAKQRAWISNALYNAACGRCYSRQKQLAIDSLKLAFQNGFDQPELLTSDSDLDSLRTLPEFQQLVKKYGQPKKTSNKQ